jgi:hypothetical protein
MGQLFGYYLQNFEQYFSNQELATTVKKLIPFRKNLTISTHQIPITTQTQEGVLEHPPLYLYQGQWVWVISDKTKFKKIIQSIMLE